MPFRPLSTLSRSSLILCGALLCTEARAESPQQLYEQGRTLSNQQRHAEAIAKFEQITKQSPELVRVLLLLGRSHLQIGHLEASLDYYERFEQTQSIPDAAAHAFLRDGYEELARKCEQPDGSSQRSAELLLLAARARFRLRQLERAGALFKQHAQLLPDPSAAQRELRERYLRDYHEAVVRTFVDDADIDQDPEKLMLLAESYLALEQGSAALDTLDRYRQITPHRTEDEARSVSALYAMYRQKNPNPPKLDADRLARYESELQPAQPAPEKIASPQTQGMVDRNQAAAREPNQRPNQLASRLILPVGSVGVGAGTGLLALGIGGLMYDGRCVDMTLPCDRVYDSRGLGIGATVAGAALILGGVAVVGVSARRSHRAIRP